MRRPRLLALCVLTVSAGLAGCADTVGLALGGATAVSLAATDKFPADHLASWMTGQDCSTLAATQTGHYCQDRTARPAVTQAPLYCYRTLAEVTCYDRPDSQAGPSRLVQ